MTAHRTVRSAARLGTAAALLLTGVVSCSSDTPTPASPQSQPKASGQASAPARSSAPPKATPKPTPTTQQVRLPAGVSGPGCEDYALEVPSGPGALDGMGRDPVAVALGNSPLLTTFAGALNGRLNGEVNLFDAVNTGQFTVFAPTDDAFGKVSPETLEKFKADPKLLTGVLNYHVALGQIQPDDIEGEHKTVQGQSVTVSGSGDRLRVNDAGVVCGGIKTANATVYLIDTVLTPPAPAAPTTTTSGSEDGTEGGTEAGADGSGDGSQSSTDSTTETVETEATPTG